MFTKGATSWNKGLKGYRAGVPKPWMSERVGELNPVWKGSKVSYRGLHLWVERQLGKPNKCEECGRIGTGHSMQWANISGNYLREVSDWRRLCSKCHGLFDKAKRNV